MAASCRTVAAGGRVIRAAIRDPQPQLQPPAAPCSRAASTYLGFPRKESFYFPSIPSPGPSPYLPVALDLSIMLEFSGRDFGSGVWAGRCPSSSASSCGTRLLLTLGFFRSPGDSAKCNVFLKGLTSVYLFVLPSSSHNTCRQLGFGGLCITSSLATDPPGSPVWRCSGGSLQRKCGLSQWLSGKESTCISGNMGSVYGSGRSSGVGNGNPLQYSCLENPVDRGSWRATVHEVSKSWTGLSD